MASLEEESSLNVLERYEFKHFIPEGLVPTNRTAAPSALRIDAHAGQRDGCEVRSSSPEPRPAALTGGLHP